MSWLKRLFSRRLYTDLSEEIRAHLEEKIEELVATGMPRKEAAAAARRQFGNLTLIQEDSRAVWRWPSIEDFLMDIRYGLRTLRKSPGFTTVAVLTLALGIGANTAIFSLIDTVLLRSLPVRDPDRLVVLKWGAHNWPGYHGYSNFGHCHIDQTEKPEFGVSGLASDPGQHRAERAGCSFSYPFFDRLRSQTAIFSSATAFAGSAGLHLDRNGERTGVSGPLVSGEFFQTLGVTAALGRTLQPTDDSPNAAPAAVLNYGYWRSKFGGDRSIVGQTIYLDRVPVTVVGVAEPNFTDLIPLSTTDIWLPLALYPRFKIDWSGNLNSDENWWLTIVARLKPGISLAQAQTATSLFFRNEMLHGAKLMSKESDDPRITLMPAQKGLVGDRWMYEKPFYLLMVAVAIVLLIACSNVGGLMLARAASRQREIAVRLALGAGRARIVRQLLTESALLSLAGGAIGIFVAYWSLTALKSGYWLGSIQGFAVKPDSRILTFTVLVSVLAGILPGLAPAFRGTRLDLTPTLKESAPTLPSLSPRRRRFSFGNALVIAQVTLSMLVLAGAGLLVRTLVNLKSIDPGFDTRNLLLFRIDPKGSGYSDQQAHNLYRELQSPFTLLPGVVSVSYASDILLSGNRWNRGLPIEGEKQNVNMNMLAVGPGFFDTMRIPLIAGRAFIPADLESTHKVVIINQEFVRRYLQNRSPLGLRLRSAGQDPGEEIIGVVGDTKYDDLKKGIEPTAYIPLKGGGAHFALRTAATPEALIPTVRAIISQLDSHLSQPNFKTQTQQIDRFLFSERLVAHLSSLFGLLALALACIGLYGLLSYEVTRRTREIGVRTALGAQHRDLLRLIIGEGIALAGVGAGVGIAAALGLTRYLQSLLYGVRPTDPATFFGVALLLTCVSLLACYLPARRAMRVDPMVALRYE